MATSRFRVITDSAGELDVTIRLGDQLRGELEASKRGLDRGAKTLGMHLSALWCWAALVREGRITTKFDDFIADVAALEPIEDDHQDDDEDDAAGPTRTAASDDSASPSPSDSPAPPPPGGSTRPSTTTA